MRAVERRDRGEPTSETPPTRGSGSRGRRDQIVDAAARLFERNGYHQTGITDIADAVGIQKSTVYHYFTSKNEILYDIHEAFIRGLYDSQLARSKRGGMTEREELAQIIQEVIDVIHERRGYVRVFFEYYRELPKEDRERIRALRKAYADLVRDVIARGAASGAFAVTDVDLATLALFGSMNWAYQWYRPGERLSRREVADLLWRHTIGGLIGLGDRA